MKVLPPLEVWTGFFSPFSFFLKTKREVVKKSLSLGGRHQRPGLWASPGERIRQEVEKICKLVWQSWGGGWGGGYCMCKDGMCFRKMLQLFLNCENLQWWSPSMNDVWEIKKNSLYLTQSQVKVDKGRFYLQLRVFGVHTLQFGSVSNIWTVTIHQSRRDVIKL